MIKNYFTIALRNLLKAKAFTIMNVSGLTVGMATAILIATWVYNEISFDRFHVNKHNIYQAWNRGKMDDKIQCWPNTPSILAPTLSSEYADIETTSRTFSRWFVASVGERNLSAKALIADPSFLKIFSFPLADGDANTALKDGYSVILTKKMALKMFDNTNVIGKEIKIDNEPYQITGVLEDLPSNTEFDFEYLMPWDYLRRSGDDEVNWANNWVFTYVLLRDGTNSNAVNEKVKDITIRHSNKTVEEEIFLHPISQWHLYSRFENGVASGGRIEVVRLFALIGIFVLLVACINFMNLTTARSEKRAKEVGIRKVAGAGRHSLIWQFITESIALAAIAGIIALVLVQAALPYFNLLINQSLVIPSGEPAFWFSIIAFVVLTGIIAGSYPAFYLSSFRPVSVLKGAFKKTQSPFNTRKVLVVSQFTFAVVLIIATLVVVKQIGFTKSRERGYNSEHLIYHWITGDLDKNYSAIKNELIQSGVASNLTRTLSPLSMIVSDTWSLEWQGKLPDDKTDFKRLSTDEDLVPTASLQLVQGRDLDLRKYPTDSTGMLINESAAKAFGFKNPIGETIKETDGTVYHIVGVVKDFIIESPDQEIKPLIMGGIKGNSVNVINIKLNGDAREAIQKTEAVFKKYNPAYPFEFHFADEDYARKFDDTSRTAALVSVFTILTIFISCLGLFGLSTYMAEVRIKEIGIRKVLGASVTRITALMVKDFLILVAIAIVIGTPVSWYFMKTWLSDFAYRTPIGWSTFVIASVGCLVLAMMTVGYQAVRASLEDPVKSLRNE